MSAPPTREKLFSVYFDTRKFTLRKHGLMLRVRHKGDKRWQTIKANTALGPFGRQEWEEEIGGDRPDMQHAKGTALARFDLKSLKHDLTSVFETDVTRTAMPLRYNGSEMEVAIDHGLVRTGQRREPISEIEVELKDGDPGGVVKIAKRIARDLPVRYGAKSKAERGYALSGGEEGTPFSPPTSRSSRKRP